MHRCPVPEPGGSPILRLGMACLAAPGAMCFIRDAVLGYEGD